MRCTHVYDLWIDCTRRSVMTAALLGCLSVAADAAGQLQLASITATVVDHRGEPVPDAVVTLNDPLGAELQRVTSDALGRGTFQGVTPGRYLVQTRAPGAVPFDLPVSVTGGLPMEMTVRVPAAVTDAVTVEGRAPDELSSRGSIAGESLTRVAVRVRGRALQDAVATLPGWSTEDNGLLHARGVDDGFLYVIDGVPVYERLDALSGFAPDLASVSAVSVITGYVPPEFGHKAGGVIEVRSASADPGWRAVADVTVGTELTNDGSVIAGGRVGTPARLRAGVRSSRSDRFLDPVHPDNLHNTGGQTTTFGQLDWVASGADRFTTGGSYGQSRFDVPNTARQEQVGQDQRQRLRQGALNTTWQRTMSSSTVTQAAAYHRRTSARLAASPFDTPLTAEASRSLIRTGGLFAVTRQQGTHLVKLGMEWQHLSLDEHFTFAITNDDEARAAEFRDEALMFTAAHPFRFAAQANRSLWSAYVQDSWQLTSRVTVSGGLRFDRSALLLTRSQVSPRAGAALRLNADTVIRAGLSRFFQPPQPENLLLSSSPESRVLSAISVGDAEGGADLEPERQWASEIGLEHRIGRRLRLDVAYWHRAIAHVADPNVFAGTTIIFPNAVAKGRARGIDARLELPRQHGFSGYLNGSIGSVVQTGPVTGGLFLEEEVEELGAGVEFVPDHDQRLTAGAGITWEHRASGLTLSAMGRYETGTPIQHDEDDFDELMARPGADRVDFATGRVKPRALLSAVAMVPVLNTGNVSAAATVQVLNLLNQRYAYNFGNPFSGTHFGAPRTVSVTLRVTFR